MHAPPPSHHISDTTHKTLETGVLALSLRSGCEVKKMREIVSTEPNAKCWRTPLFVRQLGTELANTEPNGQIGGFHLGTQHS